jgi:hypothetical protein
MARGGVRPNSGRKPKADEVALLERLSPFDDLWFKAMQDGLKAQDTAIVKLFADYRFGKPKERVDVTTDGDKINGFVLEVIRSNGETKATD